MNCLVRSLSKTTRNFLFMKQYARCYSSVDKVIIKKNEDKGIATLYMNNAPVNGLDSEMLRACTDAVKTMEQDSTVRGLVITSNFDGKVFSAGLNILDMFQKSPEHLVEFWTCVQDWFIAFYGCKKPTVAAINGHAPAGGCALAMTCDFRVMQSGGKDVKTIGLNETRLGISAPFFFVELMISTIGKRRSEESLLKGGMFTAEEAFKMGMVDKLAEPDSVLPTATEALEEFLAVPPTAFVITKMSLRQDLIKRLISVRQDDADNFAALVSQPIVQEAIGKYLANLKSRKK